jgi:hypothetical protein
MLKTALPLTLIVALSTSPAFAQQPSEGIPPNGMVVELGFGGGLTIGGVGTVATPLPSLLVGVRLIDRLNLGLGFTFFRLATHGGGVLGGAGAETDTNLFNFAPTVEVDIVRSNDHRAAFYGKAGLPIGALIINFPPPVRDDVGFVIGYHLALGARYAFNRFFAFGVETGLLGFFTNPQRSDGNNSVGITTFYGMLQATIFFAGK